MWEFYMPLGSSTGSLRPVTAPTGLGDHLIDSHAPRPRDERTEPYGRSRAIGASEGRPPLSRPVPSQGPQSISRHRQSFFFGVSPTMRSYSPAPRQTGQKFAVNVGGVSVVMAPSVGDRGPDWGPPRGLRPSITPV